MCKWGRGKTQFGTEFFTKKLRPKLKFPCPRFLRHREHYCYFKQISIQINLKLSAL